MNKKLFKTIGAKLLADITNVGLEIGIGYLYFVTLRKVSLWIKIPALMAANRLLAISLNAGTKKLKSMQQYCSKESR